MRLSRDGMIALIQRVTQARVDIRGHSVAAIGTGILALVCAERGDVSANCDSLLDRVLKYRIFGDDQGRMNLSLRDVGGGLLIVPQFTLAADTGRGARPSFSGAAEPQLARALFERFVVRARASHAVVGSGEFGAAMAVALVNDGPVTFWLRSAPKGQDTPGGEGS